MDGYVKDTITRSNITILEDSVISWPSEETQVGPTWTSTREGVADMDILCATTGALSVVTVYVKHTDSEVWESVGSASFTSKSKQVVSFDILLGDLVCVKCKGTGGSYRCGVWLSHYAVLPDIPGQPPAVANDPTRPDLWAVNVELGLSAGLYGRRQTGYITSAYVEGGDNFVSTPLNISNTNIRIVEIGGWFDRGDGVSMSIPGLVSLYLLDSTTGLGAGSFAGSGVDGTTLRTCSYMSRSNAPYDVWVKYVKIL